MLDCSRCSLRSSCNQVVPALTGDKPHVFFIDQAPSEAEDIEGESYASREGDFLKKLLIEAGLDLSQCYLTTLVKCRPPKDRKPTQLEIDTCKYWLWQELKQVEPQIIVPLGLMPAQLILKNKKLKAADVLGRSFAVAYINAMIHPWYSPKYLLRNNNKILMQKSVDFFKTIKESIINEKRPS